LRLARICYSMSQQQLPRGTGSRSLPADRLAVLVDAALDLAAAHDLDDVLTRMVERAAEVAGARYAALGIYDHDGVIARFIHYGIDDDTVRAIGRLPAGRGLLGEVIAADAPTRVENIAEDPRSVGFPEHHPEMRSFLGVPVRSVDRRHGNLYVTDKHDDAQFSDVDERLLVALAALAACAIDNALLVQSEQDRFAALERLAAAEQTGKLRQDLLEQVIAAQEAERARVARDLHDQIGQSLTSILLALRVYENAGADSDDGRKRGEELRELITDTLDDVRRLAFELRPAVLDDIGLVTALQRLADALHQRGGPHVTWTINGLDDAHRLDPTIETAVYRIAQEALTNIARHAATDEATAAIDATASSLVVEITDKGAGFEPAGETASLGIAGMKERATLIGATLTVTSHPARGTTVHLEVPR
jgi:signal transduction histidine kinase